METTSKLWKISNTWECGYCGFQKGSAHSKSKGVVGHAESKGAFIITFLARNDFQGDLGDDKRKAVLIRGLETPFRDAAFITTFSGVELRFPNYFQVDFCR